MRVESPCDFKINRFCAPCSWLSSAGLRPWGIERNRSFRIRPDACPDSATTRRRGSVLPCFGVSRGQNSAGKNGDFKTLDDLKKVTGLDFSKIQVKKDLLEF